ncbi:ENDOSPERM DEFECTIVE 1, QWRF domain containing 5, EMBRYO DEFECTIVE 3116 [Hibiscus trionum]|uniref:ENDOSPERM DEFECTIVE 1, QWRF domain containing 5, EMBRYO DEFECTIVE 3116 n=1 Tax=Hibiscus trionum TaxID=183268 RepID=A0A9W7MJ85_HIBTR|nr:ENDOSPERM DEFECTIVE 1, QWRF domain containing 5, EMBRYO DEFECTIVE 3116 [Hibiscus trionum]
MTVEAEQVAANTSHAAAPPAVPHPPPRRPRVREVSSRFMSPVSSSHSSGDPSKSILHKQHHSVSSQRQRRQPEAEVDENFPAPYESPKPSESPLQKKHCHSRTYSDGSKLLGRSTRTPLRPDTPTIERTASLPSSMRLNHRAANISSTATPKVSAAAKLLQSSGIALSSKHNASFSSQEASAMSLIDLSVSMPEADKLLSEPNRLLADRNTNINGDSLKLPACPFSRSLNSPLSTSDPSLFHHHNGLIKGKSAKMTPFSLPPVPSHTKSGTDAIRASKKVSRHQEDLHSLKLLYNCYLQWRYANAKAEASTQIQKRETERMLYSLEVKISELYDCVRRKRMELQLLQRMNTLSRILEAQMPYLEEWSDFQGDYLNSLLETIQSLSNISLRLPTSGNVKADTREIGEAMTSAIKTMDSIVCHVQSFMPKAEEMESLVSELARVAIRERAVIEECGDLLHKTNTYQVEECSLRGHLVQLQANKLQRHE